MARKKAPSADAVSETIRESVEQSKSRSRRVLCKTLFAKYGQHNRTEDRARGIERYLKIYGLTVEPSLVGAKRDDWIILRLAEDGVVIVERAPDPRPDEHWFAAIMHSEFESEREVELRFVAPLFEQLGYSEANEAVGVPVKMWEGVSPKTKEADFIYFDSEEHSLEKGNALVLVECKAPGQSIADGIGQARSYVQWIKPAYYVVTDGHQFVAFLYQGGPIKDSNVIEFHRRDLRSRFADLYRSLNIEAAREAKQQNIERFGQHPSI